MSGAWKRFSGIPMQYPMLFGATISTFKTSLSDLLVQKVVEKKEAIDWKRNLAFASFGCFYLGGVQYSLYVPIFGRMFPNAASFAAKSIREKLKDGKGLLDLGKQVFIDQCIHHPLLYFPVFYAIKEVVTKETPNLKGAMLEYKENMKEDLTALWKIWIPATIFNFAFMPMWGRIPTVAATSLVWSCVLSTMRGGDVAHSDDMAGGALTGASFKLLEEGLGEYFSSPVELDQNMTHVCVSAGGPDKVGWVSTLARAVADGGGNITHSKMVRLGKDFIVMMHVAVPHGEARQLQASLNDDKDLEQFGITVSSLTRRQTGKFIDAMTGFRIHCVGTDRPGMLAKVAEHVSERNLSVENISTEIRLMPNGQRDFIINCDCTASWKLEKKEIEAISNDFSSLKRDLELDVLDVLIHV